MRFLAKYGAFGLQVQHRIDESYATGAIRTLQPTINAQFAPGGLRPLERELAIAHWEFNGFYQEADEVSIVPPDYRIGVFDSELAQAENGWSDEIRVMVEEALIDHSQRYNEVLVVPRTTVPAPWPKYDEFAGSLAALMRKLVDDGHDLDQVLIYERESLNRPEVIGALEELINNPEPLSEIPIEEEVIG